MNTTFSPGLSETYNERMLENDTTLTGLELYAKREGYQTVVRTPDDTYSGRFYIIGPDTGFHHLLNLPTIMGTTRLRTMIANRDATLLALGWRSGEAEKWTHRVDKDDDGDRYVYEHYAVKPGDRRSLAVSSLRNDLPLQEFKLHVLMGFPRPGDLTPAPAGQIDMLALTRHLFADTHKDK